MNRRSFLNRAAKSAVLASCRAGAGTVGGFVASPLQSGMPSVTERDSSWTIQNGLVSKHLWWDGSELRGVLGTTEAPRSQPDVPGEIFVFAAGRSWPAPHASPTLKAARHGDENHSAWLELVFVAEQSPLEIAMRYMCRRNDPAIEAICRVRNVSAQPVKDLQRLDSCSLTIPLGLEPGEGLMRPKIHWVEGLHDDEKATREIYATYRVSKRELSGSDTVDWHSDHWSSNQQLPALVVEAGPRSYFAAHGWSGEWKLSAGANADSVTVRAGLAETSLSLAPGETLEMPPSFYGVVDGVPDDAWRAIHEHCRLAVMPTVPEEFPWVTYNTWYNFGTDLHEGGLREEVDRAAHLGVELFYIDDGWFEGSEPKGKWGTGSGNWVENRKKFPAGIAAFSEYVHRRGMRFGLWVEPERLDARWANQPGLPPESWLATRQGQLIRWGFADSDHEAPAFQVCFGCPDARAWTIESLTRMIRDYKVDWIKWDHNRYDICQDEHHGHGSGTGDWAHTHGVWTVLDELRRRCPQLIIENCAAGGHRFDFGMMRRTHVTWTSDQTSPGPVSRRHLYGASHPYPPQYLTSWYITEDAEPALDTRSVGELDTLFRSHMLGAFGISAKLGLWPRNATEAAARSIALYKRLRRSLRGELAWLTPQPPLRTPELREASQWEATQMCLRASGESVIFVFRAGSGESSFQVTPAFLKADKSYEIWDEDGHLGPKRRVQGTDLLHAHLRVELPARDTSAVIYLKET